MSRACANRRFGLTKDVFAIRVRGKENPQWARPIEEHVMRWVLDQHGEPAMAIGAQRDEGTVYYRAPSTNDLEKGEQL